MTCYESTYTRSAYNLLRTSPGAVDVQVLLVRFPAPILDRLHLVAVAAGATVLPALVHKCLGPRCFLPLLRRRHRRRRHCSTDGGGPLYGRRRAQTSWPRLAAAAGEGGWLPCRPPPSPQPLSCFEPWTRVAWTGSWSWPASTAPFPLSTGGPEQRRWRTSEGHRKESRQGHHFQVHLGLHHRHL